jgi:hypothetical protein
MEMGENNQPADIWSVGVTLFYSIERKVSFEGKIQIKLQKSILLDELKNFPQFLAS